MSAPADAPPTMPTWVKIALALIVVLVLIAVVVALVAPGGHGPRLHG